MAEQSERNLLAQQQTPAKDTFSGADILFQEFPPPKRLAAKPPEQPGEPPIGTATMLKDETIVLNLKAKNKDVVGEGELIFHPNDKDYNTVRRHLQGMSPGEIKLVSPFADPNDKTGPEKKAEPDKTEAPDKTQPEDRTKPTDKTLPVVPDVIVPPSAQFVKKVEDTYNKMSPEVREIVARDGAQLVPTRRITDALPELKGQKPRGWPPGSSWDAVDGAYSPTKKMIVVAEDKQAKPGIWVNGNRTEDIVRHETGHAVNAAMDYLSDDADFTQAYEDDKKKIPAADQKPLTYFLQPAGIGADETCAEGIASMEGGATGGTTFDKNFAGTMAVIKARVKAFAANLQIAPTPAGGNKPGASNNGSKDG